MPLLFYDEVQDLWRREDEERRKTHPAESGGAAVQAEPGKTGEGNAGKIHEGEEAPSLVLSDFNLQVKPGETIALVGPTGGGKTTIVNLMCRFFEPKRGVIRLNGRDYTEYTLHGIQSRIGVVLQTPHLFSGTVRENIRYGCLGATDTEIEDD